MAAVVQVAVGRPHQCSLDDYTRAVLAQLYPSETMAANPVPLAYDYGEPSALRPGRSNDKSDPVTGAEQGSPLPVGPYNVHQLQSVAGPRIDVGMSLPPVPHNSTGNGGNDTSSAATIEKLTAYYEQLKGEQESLARQQLQQQLYEQQQRRQHEFMMIQQQIHQQYYQQQQHVMLMLENLRKNPEFAKQVAMFADHKLSANVNNGTDGVPTASVEQQTVAAVKAAPDVVARVDMQKRLPEQSIRNHAKDENRDMTDGDDDDDDDEDDGWGVKRLDARQADGEHQSDDDGDQSDDDRPILAKGYTKADTK